MWTRIRFYYLAFRIWLELEMLQYFDPPYATGGYYCDLCGQEMGFHGRIDDDLSFTKPLKCHLCQRKICDDCKKVREKVFQYGEEYLLPVCVECFSGDLEDDRYVQTIGGRRMTGRTKHS